MRVRCAQSRSVWAPRVLASFGILALGFLGSVMPHAATLDTLLEFKSQPAANADPPLTKTPVTELAPAAMPAAALDNDDSLRNKIASWSLEDRIGQLLMVGFRSFDQMKRVKPGGVVLFSWSLQDIDQSHRLIRSIKEQALAHLPSPVFVAIDHEGGKVLRLRKGMTVFPDAAAVGSLNDPEMAFKFGAAMGTELAALGIHMNFAPVLDLGNARSFLENRVWGDDPKMVAKLTRAYIDGLQTARVLAIPKHFPGHGGTHKDSHFYLPVISKSFERLWNEDLVPFREAMQGSLAGIMTAHVQIPAVDRVPASLSENFLHKLLQEKLGFKGLIITDDLEMAGVSKVIPEAPEELALRSLKAGTDMILVVWSEQTQLQIIKRVKAAVVRGEVTEAWLNDKVFKIQKLKADYFLHGVQDNPFWRENIRRPETIALAREIFRRAPRWQAGHPVATRDNFLKDWDKQWSVVLPESGLSAFWKSERPNDHVFIVPKRAGSTEVAQLHRWLDQRITEKQALWVVTGPRASSSEESFQVVKGALGLLAREPVLNFPVMWVHQGASPVALLRKPEEIPLGIVSLYSGSLTGFREFYQTFFKVEPTRVDLPASATTSSRQRLDSCENNAMELSFMEMAVIGIIAFVVFGPEELIRKAAQFGRFVGKMKSQVNNFKIMAEEELLRKDLLNDLSKTIDLESAMHRSFHKDTAQVAHVESPNSPDLESEIEKNLILLQKPK